MQVRQVYEALLSELSKVGAPSILLEDFNYFLNKAINQYVNKRYNVYEINQQVSDDLRVLVRKESIQPDGETSSFTLPKKDPNNESSPIYLHLLNCVCIYKISEDYKCDFKVKDSNIRIPAKKLTADAYPEISKDYYNKPSKTNPYFFIIQDKIVIETGNDEKPLKLTNIELTYLKEPKKVVLTPDQIDSETDDSMPMEFPDYVCNEIINELVTLVMATNADPRLQVHIPVNQSIGSPIQQGQQTTK